MCVDTYHASSSLYLVYMQPFMLYVLVCSVDLDWTDIYIYKNVFIVISVTLSVL